MFYRRAGIRFTRYSDERQFWPLTLDRNGEAIDLSRVAPGGSGYAGLLCLEVEEGWYAITNTRRKVGFGLRWDVKLFPFLLYWHVYNGVPDYPWFNRVYVAGIEPWTSFPMNQEAAKAAEDARRQLLDQKALVENLHKQIVEAEKATKAKPKEVDQFKARLAATT